MQIVWRSNWNLPHISKSPWIPNDCDNTKLVSNQRIRPFLQMLREEVVPTITAEYKSSDGYSH